MTFSGNDVGLAAGGCEDYDIKSSQFVTNRWDIGVSKPSWPSDTNVSRNPFNHNKTGVSFLSSGGTLSRNSFTGNDVGFTSSGDQQPDFGAALDHNLFVRNGDGIHVEDGGNGLQANIAVRNTGWGIYAPGSTDLGGNHAFRNGNSPQCVGVAC